MPVPLRSVIHKLKPKKRVPQSLDKAAPLNDVQRVGGNPHASFLGLPPEIRNQVYEEIALTTQLNIYTTKLRKPPPPIGLLLACRQTCREYRALLLSTASIIISVADYSFNNLVRVLEQLGQADLSSLRLNSQLWILLHLSHVPSRDDRRNLLGWLDYRASPSEAPYFGPGRKAASRLLFQYDVRFLNNMRPPRPVSRYNSGFQMKLDLLRTHLRMYQELSSEECPNRELERLRNDLEDYANLLLKAEKERSDNAYSEI